MKDNTTKNLLAFVIVCVAFALFIPGGAGAVDKKTATTKIQTTNTTKNTTETQPITIIKLNVPRRRIYVNDTFTIVPTVTNQVGSVKYTSNNTKIATVNSNGVVTGKKEGKTQIIISNNGSTAVFTAVIKAPALTKGGKTITTVNVKRNKYVAVRVKAPVRTMTYTNTKYAKVISTNGTNVINIKGIKVTPKNNPTTIKVKVNGATLKLNVKVTAKTAYQKNVNLVYKHTKPKITRNYLNTIHINGLYKVKTNLVKLLNQGKITSAQFNSLNKAAEKATYSVSNKSVLTLNKKNATVKCIGTGTSFVTVKFKDGTVLTTKITVTKPETKKIKLSLDDWNEYEETGKSNRTVTAKICYDYEEIYQEFRDAFYNHIIKGENPKYQYIYCAFGKTAYNTVSKRTTQKAKRDYNDGYNFYECCSGLENSELIFNFDVLSDKKTIFIGLGYNTTLLFTDEYEKINDALYYPIKYEYSARLKAYKRYYNIAQKIFKEIHIDEFKEDYQKVTVLATWMNKNYVTDTSKEDIYHTLENILIYKQGMCPNWSSVTNYFCTLLRIPCYTLDNGYSHVWNTINVQGKWYQSDIFWRELLRGNNYMKTLSSHAVIGDISYIEDSDFNDTINKLFKVKIYATDLEYTPEYFSHQYGW